MSLDHLHRVVLTGFLRTFSSIESATAGPNHLSSACSATQSSAGVSAARSPTSRVRLSDAQRVSRAQNACGLAMFPELHRLARVISGVELDYYFSFLFK